MSFVPNRSCPTFGRLLPTRRRTSREYITPREEGATYSRDFSRRGRGKSSSRIEERGVGKRGCWKARRDFEGAGCLGGREKEGRRGARRTDSPVSHSLADRERITMRSPLPLFSRPSVGPPVHPFAHPRPSPHVRPSACLSIRSSPRLPPVTLLASLSRHQLLSSLRIRNSSPLLSPSSSSVAPFVPIYSTLLPDFSPPFSPKFSIFRSRRRIGSSTDIDRY